MALRLEPFEYYEYNDLYRSVVREWELYDKLIRQQNKNIGAMAKEASKRPQRGSVRLFCHKLNPSLSIPNPHACSASLKG